MVKRIIGSKGGSERNEKQDTDEMMDDLRRWARNSRHTSGSLSLSSLSPSFPSSYFFLFFSETMISQLLLGTDCIHNITEDFSLVPIVTILDAVYKFNIATSKKQY